MWWELHAQVTAAATYTFLSLGHKHTSHNISLDDISSARIGIQLSDSGLNFCDEYH